MALELLPLFLSFSLVIFSLEIDGLILYIKRLPAYIEGHARASNLILLFAPSHPSLTPAVAGLS